jgi:hypothetical protein
MVNVNTEGGSVHWNGMGTAFEGDTHRQASVP